MPSTDAITNFITPTKTLFAWVKTQLDAIAGLNDAQIWKETSEELLFDWIIKATRNQCIIKYSGSKYSNDGGPRRALDFDVYVVYRYMTNINTAQESSFDLLDAVINALDHNGSSDYRILVKGDTCVDFENAGLMVFRITFTAEDY